jgi:hypothetical protein
VNARLEASHEEHHGRYPARNVERSIEIQSAEGQVMQLVELNAQQIRNLDHAGAEEHSLAMAIRPELVDLWLAARNRKP